MKQKVEKFIDEERSVIKSAYDAGREAMAREKARFENPEPGVSGGAPPGGIKGGNPAHPGCRPFC